MAQYVADSSIRLDSGRRLIELGIESINVMNLRARIEDRYGVTVPLDVLASEADLAGVAAYVTSRREPIGAGSPAEKG